MRGGERRHLEILRGIADVYCLEYCGDPPQPMSESSQFLERRRGIADGAREICAQNRETLMVLAQPLVERQLKLLEGIVGEWSLDRLVIAPLNEFHR
jgi:hypothetical protein